jgi:Lon protease-like protein
MDDVISSGQLDAVPLFPLPNVVLFPRAVLPLHIFEERYKAMTADALEGDRQVAMALLRPGWEKDYYGKPAIEPVVCVGTILSCERLPDGKYNFLLQGHTRASIVREHGKRPYRVAQLQPLPISDVLEIDLTNHRLRLVELFTADVFAETALAPQFRQLLNGPTKTADIADLLAFSYFEDVALKQSLLAEGDVLHRVERTIAHLESLRPWVRSVRPARRSSGRPPSSN